MLSKHLPIVTRLTISFTLILALTVGLGLFAWNAVRTLEGAASKVEQSYMPVLDEANRMSSQVAQSVAALKDYFAVGNVDLLGEGLTSFHVAWRSGQKLQAELQGSSVLSTLALELGSLNALFAAYLQDVQNTIVANDLFLAARNRLHHDAGRAGEVGRAFLLSHLSSNEDHTPDQQDTKTSVLDTVSVIATRTWNLRLSIDRARMDNNLHEAHRLSMQWGPLAEQTQELLHVPMREACRVQLAALNRHIADAHESAQFFITAWDDEEKALNRMRHTSSLLMQSVDYLSVSVFALMRKAGNKTLDATMTAMMHIGILTVLAVLLGLGLAFALGRDITRPLRRCVDFAESVAAGHLEQTLQLERRDEVGRLAVSINSMVMRLRERIDEHARVERDMRQARFLAEKALRMARAGSWHLDADNPEFYIISPQLHDILGLPASEPTQRLLAEWQEWVGAVDMTQSRHWEHSLGKVLEGQSGQCDVTVPLLRPGDQKKIWMRILVEPLHSADGKRWILGICQDVSPYIRQQHVLEAATKAQSGFIANMSHEIRTPLNAVIGMGHLLRRTELTVHQHDYLEKIDNAAQLLLSLINDILDLSKIQAGEMHMEGIPFAVRPLLQRILDMIESMSSAEHLCLALHVDENVPEHLLGDPLRLQQVLTNLLNNACKFTSEGSVSLRVRVTQAGVRREDRQHWPSHLINICSGDELQFAVSDTGVGMNPEQCSRIFRPFTQADESITRRFGGTGLGLTICKHLSELMGGGITVESQPNVGSTFTITAFFGHVDAQEAQQALPVHEDQLSPFALSAHPGRILLVEDNDISALIAKEMLEAMGHTVDVAENGAEGVRMALSNEYNLVLMDVQMPVLDGIAATRLLRSHERLNTVPIVAMTAHAMQTDRERTQQAGMDDHITKPIDPMALRTVVERWIC